MSEMRKVNIYCWADARTPDHIRYVGKTADSDVKELKAVERRVKNEICEAVKDNLKGKRCDLIRKITNEGGELTYKVIDICDETNWIEHEQYYIAKYWVEGHDLVNETIGGNGASGYKINEEHRQLLIELGKKFPREHFVMMNRKRNEQDMSHSLETRKKIGNAQRGKKESKQAVENMTASLKKLYENPKQKEKIRNLCIQYWQSEEGRKMAKGMAKKRKESLQKLRNLVNGNTRFKVMRYFRIFDSVKNLTYNFSSLRHLTSLDQLSE